MHNLKKIPRAESAIFDDLVSLCAEKGFAHALAYISFQSNVGKQKPEQEIIIETEVSILIGCMCKAPINWEMPTPEKFQEMITRSLDLLSEVHDRLNEDALSQYMSSPKRDGYLKGSGEALREAVFYSSQSAYSFQYRDMATQRYEADSEWLLKNKGYRPKIVQKILRAIHDIQCDSLKECFEKLKDKHSDKWTFLPGFELDVPKIVTKTELGEDEVCAFLDAFSYPLHSTNDTYNHVDDFNLANAAPLLKNGDGSYVLFQYYSLAESTYDAPFYWFIKDKKYFPKSTKHKGEFTENFLFQRLILIFGEDAVYQNVDVYQGKQRVGEIDCLVIFGGYALQFQAKSQRLTLPSRKGSIHQLEADFKRAVQKAYDQAKTCALVFGKDDTLFRNSDGNLIDTSKINHVYPICVVSDHYPALTFQALQFLEYSIEGVLEPPLVCDVFLIDAITEVLPSPLRFLSYICLRAKAGEKVWASNELVTFGFYLKKGLWFEDDLDIASFHDSISTDLDTAMAVRRDGCSGNDTPAGILTRLKNTFIGRLVSEIEYNPNGACVGIGIRLLELSEKSVRNFSSDLTKMIKHSKKTGKKRDLSILFPHVKSGLTIHIKDLSPTQGESEIRDHMNRRKYVEQADSWYGIIISPSSREVQFGAMIEFVYSYDPAMEIYTANMPKIKSPV